MQTHKHTHQRIWLFFCRVCTLFAVNIIIMSRLFEWETDWCYPIGKFKCGKHQRQWLQQQQRRTISVNVRAKMNIFQLFERFNFSTDEKKRMNNVEQLMHVSKDRRVECVCVCVAISAG